VPEQVVRELREREDVDEIEEQLHLRHRRDVARAPFAEPVGQHRVSSHSRHRDGARVQS